MNYKMIPYHHRHHHQRHQDHRRGLLAFQEDQEDTAVVEVHLIYGDTTDLVTMRYPLVDQDLVAGVQRMQQDRIVEDVIVEVEVEVPTVEDTPGMMIITTNHTTENIMETGDRRETMTIIKIKEEDILLIDAVTPGQDPRAQDHQVTRRSIRTDIRILERLMVSPRIGGRTLRDCHLLTTKEVGQTACRRPKIPRSGAKRGLPMMRMADRKTEKEST